MLAVCLSFGITAQTSVSQAVRSIRPSQSKTPVAQLVNQERKIKIPAKALKLPPESWRHRSATPGLRYLPDPDKIVIKGQTLTKAPQQINYNVDIIGAIDYLEEGTTASWGLFSIKPTGNTPLVLDAYCSLAYGAYDRDGIYYLNNAEGSMGYLSSITRYAFDMEDWSLVSTVTDVPVNHIGLGMATDPVSGYVYGCFFSEDGSDIFFGKYDIDTDEVECISPLATQLVAVGFTRAGDCYGIDKNGDLVQIDKMSGNQTLVKSTGLSTEYLSSGTLDYRTDTFYYILNDGNDYNAYAIDIHTGETSFGWRVGGLVTGAVIPLPAADDDAPDFASGLHADFTAGSLSGFLSFTAPANSFGGQPLSGKLGYEVMADKQSLAIGTVDPGKSITVPINVSEAGLHEFYVYITNAAGRSPRSEVVTMWVGPDAPAAPKEARIEVDGNKITFSWSEVTGGLNGGYIDLSSLTYTVSRYDNGQLSKSVADLTSTSYSETLDLPDGLLSVRYEVKAVADGIASSPTSSTSRLFGQINPPYSQDFSNPDSQNEFVVIDSNEDGITWEWDSDGCMTLRFSFEDDSNDWLISAPVNLKAGNFYDFSIDVKKSSNAFTEAFRVMLGSAPSPSAMDMEIIPETFIPSSDYTTYTRIISVPVDGLYHIGIQGISPIDQLGLSVTNLNILAGMSRSVPGYVTDVKLSGQYDGSNALDISFKAPSFDISGQPLTSDITITVSRDGTEVKRFENVARGEACSFTDRASESGDVTYSFIASNADGAGKPFNATGHMGVNLASAPINAKAVENPTRSGEVTISWDAVAKDVDGTEIDPSLISYVIYDDNEDVVMSDIPASSPSYTYQALSSDESQEFLYWFIVPVTDCGENLSADGYAITDMKPYGLPYTMPFEESFKSGGFAYRWMVDGPGWSLVQSCTVPACEPVDGDGGMFVFNPANQVMTSSLYSGKIIVADDPKATLNFFYFPTDGESYSLQPKVIYDGKSVNLGEPILSNASDTGDWTSVMLSLSDYAGKTIQIVFEATCLTYDAILCLDKIEARVFNDHDLSAGSIKAPVSVVAGQSVLVNAQVRNIGREKSTPCTADIYVNSEKSGSVSIDGLDAGTSATLNFEVPTTIFSDSELKVQLKVNYSADENPSNDLSDVAMVKVTAPTLATPSDLSGVTTSSVNHLSWTAPEVSTDPISFTDGAEDYDDWAIDLAGSWSFFDGDNGRTYGFEGAEFPGAFEPAAWRVFNPGAIFTDGDERVRSGHKVFAAFGTAGQSDDWMISPLLPGCSQTLRFWAAEWTSDYGPEIMEVLYSTTGKDISDFQLIGEPYEVWEEWTEYVIEIPEGTTYFAVRCVSEDIFILMTDDFSFKIAPEGGELLGYNVYRDCRKINSEIVTSPSYDDIDFDMDVDHTYHVTSVYERGESAVSNPWNMKSAGIGDVEADTPDSSAIYYNLQGIRVDHPIPGNIYIKVCDHDSSKILFR